VWLKDLVRVRVKVRVKARVRARVRVRAMVRVRLIERLVDLVRGCVGQSLVRLLHLVRVRVTG
jgi:hypothetical protein